MKKVFLFVLLFACAVPPVFGQGQVQLVPDQQSQDQKEDGGPVFYFSTGFQVTEPNGGEILEIGNVYRVRWEFPETVQNVTIRFTSDGGMDWKIVAYNIPNDGSHLWTIPPEPSTNCLVMVEDVDDTDTNDQSDDYFTISGSPGQFNFSGQ